MIINRPVNPSFDLKPAFHHIYEASLIKQYIHNKSVLDIGCWSGQFLSLIQNEAKCIGLDPSKNAIEFAKKQRNGMYIVGSALKLPFEENSFDCVTMWDVIEHLPKGTEQRAIQEILRVLKQNGIFAISTVTTHPLSILMDPAFFLMGHRHYSEKFLTDLLSRNKLKVIRIEYGGGIWTLMRSNIDLLIKHLFHKKMQLGSLDKLAENEYKGNGFSGIHIIAKKQ